MHGQAWKAPIEGHAFKAVLAPAKTETKGETNMTYIFLFGIILLCVYAFTKKR